MLGVIKILETMYNYKKFSNFQLIILNKFLHYSFYAHKSFSGFYEDLLIFKDRILLDNSIDQLNNFCKKK